MKWDELPQQFFPETFMDKLYRDYKIDSAHQESTHEKLESAARKWYYSRNAGDVDASPREVRQAISKLSKHAGILKKLLENTPDAVWSELVSASDFVNRDRYDSRIHDDSHYYPEDGLIGNPAITVVGDNERGPLVTITISDLKQALRELTFTADISSQITPAVKQGPQPDKPLQNWVTDMRNIWYKPLDRPFTVQGDKGEPISIAAQFCVEVYAHLAPETTKSRVMNEMKKRMAEEKALLIKFPHWKK
ncbi:MAG: hypothetical protein KAS85_06780 [Rhodobacteraceae bacterium]|nr:hypothetical protein [Paracoccaceae bacterium]